MDDYKVVFQMVPYLVDNRGFSRALRAEEAKAVGLKTPIIVGDTSSYTECLSLLKEKITQIQECLNATNEG